MPRIEIDGRNVEVEAGTTIIEAAKRLDIYIPHFCYHPKLTIAANCRMCLVEVERVAKAVPACATPVADGMRVFTQSRKTKSAQKAVMEFLLINHPLDCPICDQGGECDLQDLAVGFGGSHSRYYLMKRVVKDKDVGPLIETEMTRCIHCTRCVRFTQEIAGLQELGGVGRGEHTEIGTYIERSISSELSGNVIDLCPVGALTSKPFRYTARPWELKNTASVCPHCSTGCNLTLHSRGGEIMRVLPRDNEAVNESWICDKGRFSYPGAKAEDRLTQALVKQHGQWRAVTWEEALEAAVAGLRGALGTHGPEAVGALASPRASTEELYLFQKLMRALGVANLDHRLSQVDTRADETAPPFPTLNVSLEALESQPFTLLVGADPRKQQPITNHRLRKASMAGCRVAAVTGRRYDFNYPVLQAVAPGPNQETALLTRLLEFLTGEASEDDSGLAEIARYLRSEEAPLILLGNDAASHPQAAVIERLAMQIAARCGARVGHLAEFGNSAGAWLTGCVPHRLPGGERAGKQGLSAYEMLSRGMRAYVLLDLEPGLEAWNGALARRRLGEADFVLSLSAFSGEQLAYADVILPIAPFVESSGSFVNNEGRVQFFRTAGRPEGDSRPAWKVLRVLGNMLGLNGFEHNDVAELTREWQSAVGKIRLAAEQGVPVVEAQSGSAPENGLWRLGSVPIYRSDAIVRRSEPLALAQGGPEARMHPDQARELGLRPGEDVVVFGEGEAVALPVLLDDGVPPGSIAIPGGFEETVELGPLSGWVRVKRGQQAEAAHD